MTTLLETAPKIKTDETIESSQPSPLRPKHAFTARDLVIALVGITAVVYWNSFAGQLVFDDILQITDNPNIRQLWPLADWQRPLGYFTFQLNYALGGLQPRGYHVLNLLIHLGNSLLLFAIVWQCLASRAGADQSAAGSDFIAFAIALLWSVHPLTTSAVTYTVQRLEALMALCVLACLYAVLRSSDQRHSKSWKLIAILSMTLGVLTKEVMITCWPVALLFDRAFVAGSWGELWQRRRGFYCLLALPLAWTFITMRMTNAEEYAAGFGFSGVTPWEYLRSQPLVLLHYLRLTFWPDVLLLDYGWPVATDPLSIYLPGLIIVALLGISLWGVARHPRVGCVALGAFLVLGPSSSIMPIADLCFEHRMYLPLMALVALVVLCVDWLLRRNLHHQQHVQAAAGLLMLAALALGYRTTLRNSDYADPIRLWEKNVAARPMHSRPHLLLAMLYDRAGRSADAGREYQAAVAAQPDYFKGLLNLGGWHFRQGAMPEAAQCFARAAEVEPKSPAGFTQWGRTLLEMCETTAAREQLQRALQLDPYNAVAIRAFAWLLATSPITAERDGFKALKLLQALPPDPQQQDVWRLDVLAAAHAETGDFTTAVATAELAQSRAREQQRPAALQGQLQARLDAYLAKQPWRLQAQP